VQAPGVAWSQDTVSQAQGLTRATVRSAGPVGGDPSGPGDEVWRFTWCVCGGGGSWVRGDSRSGLSYSAGAAPCQVMSLARLAWPGPARPGLAAGGCRRPRMGGQGACTAQSRPASPGTVLPERTTPMRPRSGAGILPHDSDPGPASLSRI
jgi:hypothetical protein